MRMRLTEAEAEALASASAAELVGEKERRQLARPWVRGCLPAAAATFFACKKVEDRERRPSTTHRARRKRGPERGAGGLSRSARL
eukprot:CAMPEP_0178998558 /NCGR_PEP_ID=MMETSP0795-20121207/9575_1 /TAXON_ID=88552 /ORGANISM="Amoebophrya sp., Strain Ameob2" /LENGTH=84 /DNA_ID=CAMNT_0020691241 /DNA_START=576 /DNA_END=829 /DNA_ORIENTATION=+